MDQRAEAVVDKAHDVGLLILAAGNEEVLRSAPPLNTMREEIDEAIKKHEAAFRVLE